MTTAHRAVGCLGRIASQCVGQGTDQKLFIKNCDLPGTDKVWYNSAKGRCYSIDVDGSCSAMPDGYTPVEIADDDDDIYDSCPECISSQGEIPDACSCSTAEWNEMCGTTGTCGDHPEQVYQKYKISGYSDTFFQGSGGHYAGACASCASGVTGSTPHWDGSFECEEGSRCSWPLDVTGFTTHQVNGLYTAPGPGLRLVPGSYWQVQINCWSDPLGEAVTVWEGRKSAGARPIGVYERETSVTMCSTNRSSITVILD